MNKFHRFTSIFTFLFTISVFAGCGGSSGSGGNVGNVGDPITSLGKPVNLSRNEIAREITRGRDGNFQGQPGSGSADDASNYAGTNVQHEGIDEGIDEGDIIKVDENYIYMLSREGLTIVNVAGETMSGSCKIEYDNFYPDEMFIFGDTLIVIGGVYSKLDYGGLPVPGIGVVAPDSMAPALRWRTATKIMIYNLNDRVNLALLDEHEITGYFVTSRLINNKLVVAVNHNISAYDENTFFPKINGAEINAKDIYVYKTSELYNYTILASINIDSLKLDYTAHLGLYGEIYVSADNMYFFCSNAEQISAEWKYNTIIVKMNLNSLKYAASGKIDGVVYDRYWADEYKNNLRVVSYVYGWPAQDYTMLHVLDNNLNVIGKIDGIAHGERVFAVRFNKDEGGIVTFLQIDPLFKLDLSNPKNPLISDGLKDDGVSDYIQYLDQNTVLGLGREGDGAGTLFGIKVSLYDYSGADAIVIAEHVFKSNNGSGYYNANSEALWNPKAILNDPANNLFAFAINITENNVYTNGLAVFNYDLSAPVNKLLFKGILSNVGTKPYMGQTWEEYYNDYLCYVTRGVRIRDKIYTISERYIVSYDISTLGLIDQFDVDQFLGNAE